MPYLKAAAVFVLAVSLTACGFQLRGSQAATALPESWQRFNLVTGNPNSEFSREVEARFAANGIVWVERNEADYLLRLGPERFSQRNLSLNAQARAAEFEPRAPRSELIFFSGDYSERRFRHRLTRGLPRAVPLRHRLRRSGGRHDGLGMCEVV